jgi:hypothetical protein
MFPPSFGGEGKAASDAASNAKFHILGAAAISYCHDGTSRLFFAPQVRHRA